MLIGGSGGPTATAAVGIDAGMEDAVVGAPTAKDELGVGVWVPAVGATVPVVVVFVMGAAGPVAEVVAMGATVPAVVTGVVAVLKVDVCWPVVPVTGDDVGLATEVDAAVCAVVVGWDVTVLLGKVPVVETVRPEGIACSVELDGTATVGDGVIVTQTT